MQSYNIGFTVSKATATRDIKELEDKGLLKNIGTKGSSAIYKLGVGSQLAHAKKAHLFVFVPHSASAAIWDIKDLVEKSILKQTDEGGRNVNYEVAF